MPRLRPLAFCAMLLATSVTCAQMPSMGAQRNPTFKPGGPDDLWNVTMKMEIEGMPMQMPEQTMQVCTKKGQNDANLVPANDQCTVTDVKRSGNRMTFAMACKGDPPMSGTGEITSTGNSYRGRMTVRSTKRGEEMTMTQTFSGQRVGDCTDMSQQYVAKIEADSKAAHAKACSDQIDALSHPLFEPGGTCAGQRKQFCDRAASVANDMREPAGHAAARRRYATLQGAFTFCGVDYEAVTKTACGRAVGTRNWTFVGSGACDADVRVQGPKYCVTGANRSPDPQFAGLCARHATLTRGNPAANAGTSSGTLATDKPAQQDPVTQGVDAVRRMFKF